MAADRPVAGGEREAAARSRPRRRPAAACTSSSVPIRSSRSCAAASAACTRSGCPSFGESTMQSKPVVRPGMTMDPATRGGGGRRARRVPARRRRRPAACARRTRRRRASTSRSCSTTSRARIASSRPTSSATRSAPRSQRRIPGEFELVLDDPRRISERAADVRTTDDPVPSWSALVAVYQSVLHDVVAALDERRGHGLRRLLRARVPRARRSRRTGCR